MIDVTGHATITSSLLRSLSFPSDSIRVSSYQGQKARLSTDSQTNPYLTRLRGKCMSRGAINKLVFKVLKLCFNLNAKTVQEY